VRRIGELELGELGQEAGDVGGVAGVEAILGSFEFGEEMVGTVGSGRHGRRNSVTQSGLKRICEKKILTES